MTRGAETAAMVAPMIGCDWVGPLQKRSSAQMPAVTEFLVIFKTLRTFRASVFVLREMRTVSGFERLIASLRALPRERRKIAGENVVEGAVAPALEASIANAFGGQSELAELPRHPGFSDRFAAVHLRPVTVFQADEVGHQVLSRDLIEF